MMFHSKWEEAVEVLSSTPHDNGGS